MNTMDPMADMYGDVVEGHTRMDQLAARVERIEAELETAGPEGLALASRVAATGGRWYWRRLTILGDTW